MLMLTTMTRAYARRRARHCFYPLFGGGVRSQGRLAWLADASASLPWSRHCGRRLVSWGYKVSYGVKHALGIPDSFATQALVMRQRWFALYTISAMTGL